MKPPRPQPRPATIRPGSYPGTRVPQHIHYEVGADGHGPRVFEIVFDDDPLVTDDIRRRAAQPGSIYSLRRVGRGPPERASSSRTSCSVQDCDER